MGDARNDDWRVGFRSRLKLSFCGSPFPQAQGLLPQLSLSSEVVATLTPRGSQGRVARRRVVPKGRVHCHQLEQALEERREVRHRSRDRRAVDQGMEERRQVDEAHHVFQVFRGAQRRMRAAVQQAPIEHQIVFGTRHYPRQVLVLLVIAVEARQLLPAVRRIVERIEVQREPLRRSVKRGDELVDQQTHEGGRTNACRSRSRTATVSADWPSPHPGWSGRRGA